MAGFISWRIAIAAAWIAQVEATRAQGYAVDAGNYIAGATVVAAPVWMANGNPSHALVAIGIGATLATDALAAGMLAGARIISTQMGAAKPQLFRKPN